MSHRKPAYQQKTVTKILTVDQLSFKQLFNRLFGVIAWRFKKKEYLGKKCKYLGKYWKITGETYDFFFVRQYPKVTFKKAGNLYKIK